MLSKRERLFSAIEQLNGLICPTCRKPLDRQGDSLVCESGHLLNVNRRGCLNLLSARVDTFYDAALFASRQRVFDAGCYRSVADLLRTMLPDHPARILEKTLSTLIQSVVIFANGRIWPQKTSCSSCHRMFFSYSGYKLDLGPILECIVHVLFGVDRSMVKQTAPERCVKFSN